MIVRSVVCQLTLLLAVSFFFTGCSPIAETQLDEQKNPHFLAGKSRLNSMDYKRAIESFEKALEANPRSASAHFELGLLYQQRMNDFAAAIYHFQKHLQLRPTSNLADFAGQQINYCKIELAKDVSLSLVNQQVQAALEKLTSENTALRQQVEQLKTQIAQQPAIAPNRIAPPTNLTARTETLPVTPPSTSPVERALGPKPGVESSRAAAPARTHVVKPRETLASISRLYRVDLNALLAANAGITPRKLRVGQTVIIPAGKP